MHGTRGRGEGIGRGNRRGGTGWMRERRNEAGWKEGRRRKGEKGRGRVKRRTMGGRNGRAIRKLVRDKE